MYRLLLKLLVVPESSQKRYLMIFSITWALLSINIISLENLNSQAFCLIRKANGCSVDLMIIFCSEYIFDFSFNS